jgi:hypothetical protein
VEQSDSNRRGARFAPAARAVPPKAHRDRLLVGWHGRPGCSRQRLVLVSLEEPVNAVRTISQGNAASCAALLACWGAVLGRAIGVSALAMTLAAGPGCGAAAVTGGIDYVAPPELLDYGRLEMGVLARDTVIQGTQYPAGSRVVFHKGDGLLLVHLAEDTEIQGITYRSAAGGYPAGPVIFHENGKVARGVLPAQRTIQGIPCKGHRFVTFSEDGALEDATLAADRTFYGRAFPAGTQLEFYASGRVQTATVTADTTTQGLAVEGLVWKSVTFYENGQIMLGWLAADSVVQGVHHDTRTMVQFDESGKLFRAEVQEDEEESSTEQEPSTDHEPSTDPGTLTDQDSSTVGE